MVDAVSVGPQAGSQSEVCTNRNLHFGHPPQCTDRVEYERHGPMYSQGDHNEEFVRGSDVIVIHPGSNYLRIGLATDALPVTIPHCIARRLRQPLKRRNPDGRLSVCGAEVFDAC